MKKIKLVKESYTDHNDNECYYVEGVENTVEVTFDYNSWKATMYEMCDTVVRQVWADTPRKATNLLLKNFDLKLGEVA